MDNANVKIAVVGAGLIGRKHIDVVRATAQLGAIIDPAPEAVTLAARLDVPIYSDLAEALSHNRFDGVIVASPNALHRLHGDLCLDAGLPALIEKPLADSLEDADHLAARSSSTGVPILVGHHRRHSNIARTVRDTLERGALGRVATVNAQFWLYKPDDYFDVEWRTQTGGGPTFINLIHDIDLLRWFCGDVIAVNAIESSAIRGFDVEDTSVVALQFEGGALGTISISDTVAAPWSWELTAGENPAYPKTDQSSYMIGGTEGSLSVPDLHLWHHPNQKSWWAPIETKRLIAPPNDPIEAQFQHFLSVIRGEAKPLVSAKEGAANLRVLTAIKRAAKSRRMELVSPGAVP